MSAIAASAVTQNMAALWRAQAIRREASEIRNQVKSIKRMHEGWLAIADVLLMNPSCLETEPVERMMRWVRYSNATTRRQLLLLIGATPRTKLGELGDRRRVLLSDTIKARFSEATRRTA
jgi:hypothetical protein